jgi:hypothetical protein
MQWAIESWPCKGTVSLQSDAATILMSIPLSKYHIPLASAGEQATHDGCLRAGDLKSRLSMEQQPAADEHLEKRCSH